ncbi:hypothetical protein Taro_043724 [Colocasia esculenta]|uniref:Uncharacterized protein n=1 Tax=Colocasia esculenta TaxID=4460 RepID=A0A843WST1_COLES|nr:hypothetical protein [Colocasia esculenta]
MHGVHAWLEQVQRRWWTFRLAVLVGVIGVDANLSVQQVIGSPEGCSLSSLSSPLAPASRPRFLKLPTGAEEQLDDRRTRGIAELREERSRRGAICVGALGGLGVRARRTSLVRRPVPGRVVAVQGQHPQQSSFSSVVL